MDSLWLIAQLTGDPILLGLIIMVVLTNEVMKAAAFLGKVFSEGGCLLPILLIIGLLILAAV